MDGVSRVSGLLLTPMRSDRSTALDDLLRMSKFAFFLLDEALVANVGTTSLLHIHGADDAEGSKLRSLAFAQDLVPGIEQFPVLRAYVAGFNVGMQSGRQSAEAVEHLRTLMEGGGEVAGQLRDLELEGFLRFDAIGTEIPHGVRRPLELSSEDLRQAAELAREFFEGDDEMDTRITRMPAVLREFAWRTHEEFWINAVEQMPSEVIPFGLLRPVKPAVGGSIPLDALTIASGLISEAAPALADMHVADLLALREELREPAAAYRSAISRATRELPLTSTSQVHQYWMEEVEPQLRRFQQELRTSRVVARLVSQIDFTDVATIGAGVGVALGTAGTTTRGLALGAPLALKAIRGVLDERKFEADLASSRPFYFLHSLRQSSQG